MSKNWVADIAKMHDVYGFTEKYKELTDEERKTYLKFRVAFLDEELTELKTQLDNPEEIVDALIDLCVVAIGTLDAYDVNAQKAWDEVLKANMNKYPGVKESRPNPLRLPDLIKPDNWKAPSHKGNHGVLVPVPKPTLFEKIKGFFA